MHRHAHGGMDVAADLEGAGIGEGFVKILARRLLVGIEQSIDIDLMDEAVPVGEGQGLAAIDGDFTGVKGAAFLRDRKVRGICLLLLVGLQGSLAGGSPLNERAATRCTYTSNMRAKS